MKILNYTGKRIGIVNERGMPYQNLPSEGNAKCEIIVHNWSKSSDPDTKVRGLPGPDRNLATYYIVNRDVAEFFGPARWDLLIPEDPFLWQGATYYRKLSKIA